MPGSDECVGIKGGRGLVCPGRAHAYARNVGLINALQRVIRTLIRRGDLVIALPDLRQAGTVNFDLPAGMTLGINDGSRFDINDEY